MSKKEAPLEEKVFYFALNYLRYIIVITQLVVIVVFFYRFQVDQKIIDLKESVDQKKEIVNIVLPLLTEANQIDKKTTEIEKIFINQNSFSSMMSYIISVFPETATLTNFESNNNSLVITGTASDPRHLQAFFNVLKRDKKFNDIEFQNIKKTDSGYGFTIALNDYEKK